jgi:hypothetical protein
MSVISNSYQWSYLKLWFRTKSWIIICCWSSSCVHVINSHIARWVLKYIFLKCISIEIDMPRKRYQMQNWTIVLHQISWIYKCSKRLRSFHRANALKSWTSDCDLKARSCRCQRRWWSQIARWKPSWWDSNRRLIFFAY